MRNELTEIQPFIHEKMSSFFHIQDEVEKNQNNRLYIADFILTCKISGIKLGIECKSKDVVRGSEVFDWIMQAKEYSKVFNIPFFVFPHIQNRIFIDPDHKNLSHGNNVSTFLGRLGVGELLSEYIEHKEWEQLDNGKYLPPTIHNYIKFKFVHSSRVLWYNDFDSCMPKVKSYEYIKRSIL